MTRHTTNWELTATDAETPKQLKLTSKIMFWRLDENGVCIPSRMYSVVSGQFSIIQKNPTFDNTTPSFLLFHLITPHHYISIFIIKSTNWVQRLLIAIYNVQNFDSKQIKRNLLNEEFNQNQRLTEPQPWVSNNLREKPQFLNTSFLHFFQRIFGLFQVLLWPIVWAENFVKLCRQLIISAKDFAVNILYTCLEVTISGAMLAIKITLLFWAIMFVLFFCISIFVIIGSTLIFEAIFCPNLFRDISFLIDAALLQIFYLYKIWIFFGCCCWLIYYIQQRYSKIKVTVIHS